jgi:hypothetical protein
MITMETHNGDSKMQTNGAVITGRYMIASRKDGRVFSGMVESVKALDKGTLVVLTWFSHDEENYGHKYRSFYLDSLTGWEMYLDGEEYDCAIACMVEA